MRIKEHSKLTSLGKTEKSRLAMIPWEEEHRIKWNVEEESPTVDVQFKDMVTLKGNGRHVVVT